MSKTNSFQLFEDITSDAWNADLNSLCISKAYELRKLSWLGIPPIHRPIVWKLLLDYMPPRAERRANQFAKKFKEYTDLRKDYFEGVEQQQETFNQIQKDTRRMATIALNPEFIAMFDRILLIWSSRHPASGYVQGMNDLVTPFFIVFLGEHIQIETDPDGKLLLNETLGKTSLDEIECSTFWCLNNFINTIQSHYTFAQESVQKSIHQLIYLIKFFDSKLHQKLISNDIDYIQFAFRWMNNLLLREIPLSCGIRLFDTYLSEKDELPKFHVYVCAAFLTHFSDRLMAEPDFQSLLLLLQHLPTEHWKIKDIDMILAKAHYYRSLYAGCNEAKNLQL